MTENSYILYCTDKDPNECSGSSTESVYVLAVIFTTAVFSCILVAQICCTCANCTSPTYTLVASAGSRSSQPAQPLLTLLGATDVLRLSWSLAGTYSPTAPTLVPDRHDALE